MRIIYNGDAVRDTIETIIHTRAIPLYLSVPKRSSCFACGGSDPFCPVCHGENVAVVYYDVVASGLVRWSNGDVLRPKPYGTITEGQCHVVFPWVESFHPEIHIPTGEIIYPFTDITTFPAAVQELYTMCVASGLLTLLQEVQYIKIYDRIFQALSITQRGVPRNRIHVVCRQVDSPDIRPF